MKDNLTERIFAWKKIQSSHKEVRTVSITESKTDGGEFEMVLKMSVRVVDMAQSENVSISRKTKTSQQSAADSIGENDVDQFNSAARELENDFSQKCGKTYERLSRISNQGDVERNPYN